MLSARWSTSVHQPVLRPVGLHFRPSLLRNGNMQGGILTQELCPVKKPFHPVVPQIKLPSLYTVSIQIIFKLPVMHRDGNERLYPRIQPVTVQYEAARLRRFLPTVPVRRQCSLPSRSSFRFTPLMNPPSFPPSMKSNEVSRPSNGGKTRRKLTLPESGIYTRCPNATPSQHARDSLAPSQHRANAGRNPVASNTSYGCKPPYIRL